MSISSPRLDPDGQYPSPYRGVTRIDTPAPGCKEYKLYNSEGGYMGVVILAERYATADTEQLIVAIQEMNDPIVAEQPPPHLTLLRTA